MEWQKLIRDNEHWLATYCALAKFIGWLLIFFGVFNFLGGIYARFAHPEVYSHENFFYGVFILPFTDALLPGLLALVVGGFLRYLLNPEEEAGFFLRHGDKVLYFAAAVSCLRIGGMLPILNRLYTSNAILDILWVSGLVVVPNLLLRIAQVLIAIGLAQGLRRMLAAIQDSKTLV